MHLSYKISTKPRNKFVMLASIILCFVLIFLGTFQATPLVLDTDADTNTYWSDYATSLNPDATTGKYYVYTPGQLAYIFLKLPKSNTINVELMADIEMGAHIWNSTTFDANLNFEGHAHNIINLKCNNSATCGLIKSSQSGDITFKNTRLVVDFNLTSKLNDLAYISNDLVFVSAGKVKDHNYERGIHIIDSKYRKKYYNSYTRTYDDCWQLYYNGNIFYGDTVGAFICEKTGNYGSLTFDSCSTHGNILINQDLDSVGGFVGSISSYFYATKCFNNITIQHNSGSIYHAGGIAGYYYGYSSSDKHSQIYNCGNLGNIIGNFLYVGGLVGFAQHISVKQLQCYNCAKIETAFNIDIYDRPNFCSSDYHVISGSINGIAGGLFGYIRDSFFNPYDTENIYSNLSFAYNTGEVISNNIAGGIVGDVSKYSSNSLNFSNIYSTGDVKVPQTSLFGKVQTQSKIVAKSSNNHFLILGLNSTNSSNQIKIKDLWEDKASQTVEIACKQLKDISLIGVGAEDYINVISNVYKSKQNLYDELQEDFLVSIDFVTTAFSHLPNLPKSSPTSTYSFDLSNKMKDATDPECLPINDYYNGEYSKIGYFDTVDTNNLFGSESDSLFYDLLTLKRYVHAIRYGRYGVFEIYEQEITSTPTNKYRTFVCYNYNSSTGHVDICLCICRIYKETVTEYNSRFEKVSYSVEVAGNVLQDIKFDFDLNIPKNFCQQEQITADKFDGDVFVQSDGDLPVFKDLVW